MDNLAVELRNALKSFLAKATDQQFAELLADADRGVYSKIDIPVAALHKVITFADKPITYTTFSGSFHVATTLQKDKALGEKTMVVGQTQFVSTPQTNSGVLSSLGDAYPELPKAA